MRRHFERKVVVITGGAGGIGQALARRFAAGGEDHGGVDVLFNNAGAVHRSRPLSMAVLAPG